MTRICALLAIVAAWAAGCGGADPPTPPASPVADPALARASPAEGEVLIRGELSPASHGPYEFSGRYTVSFEQYAPEDPELDFTQHTSFVATLNTEAEIERRDSIRLFQTSRRTRKKRFELEGRYFVDVSFGDFPYIIRFTPRRPQGEATTAVR